MTCASKHLASPTRAKAIKATVSVSSANHRLAGRRLDSLPGLFSPVAQSALMLRLAAQVEDYQGRPALESGLPLQLAPPFVGAFPMRTHSCSTRGRLEPLLLTRGSPCAGVQIPLASLPLLGAFAESTLWAAPPIRLIRDASNLKCVRGVRRPKLIADLGSDFPVGRSPLEPSLFAEGSSSPRPHCLRRSLMEDGRTAVARPIVIVVPSTPPEKHQARVRGGKAALG